MSNKYPYLNSVNLSNKSTNEINRVKASNLMVLEAPCLNIESLNFNENKTVSTDADISGRVNGTLSHENNVESQFNDNHLTNVHNIYNCDSSVSSLSSLASTSDLSCYSNNVFDTQNIYPNSSNNCHFKAHSKPSLLNHLSNFINRKKSEMKLNGENSVKSTTCLILNDRPIGLPPKDPNEVKKHKEEYSKLINTIKRREQQQSKELHNRERAKLNHEQRQSELTHVWRELILSDWSVQQHSKFVRHLWWEGIPSSQRHRVWQLCIINVLRLTATHYDNFLGQMLERIQLYQQQDQQQNYTSTNQDNQSNTTANQRDSNYSAYDVYISETTMHSIRSSASYNFPSISDSNSDHVSKYDEFDDSNTAVSPLSAQIPPSTSAQCEIRQTLLNTIKLDVSRTFPYLNLFQEGGPHHDSLYRLLGAYTCYRPDIGYVQGMSFLAAVLVLVMPEPAQAFICFANILEMPCHNAFYSLDERQFLVHIATFRVLLEQYLPQLYCHFQQHKLELNMFLCDWLFTIFSRVVNLETALRVWDIFVRDGEVALFRAALAILRYYESRLVDSDFDQMAQFLTGHLPQDLTPELLVGQMRLITLTRKKFNEVKDKITAESR